MFVVYNLGVMVLFLLLLPLALLFVLAKPNLASEFAERLGLLPKAHLSYLQDLKRENKEIVLLSAASVGEIMMAQQIIGELIKTNPAIGHVIMTNSSSGQQVAKKLFGSEKVILQPIDLFWSANRVVHKVKPRLTILVEFEMWPNFIHCLSKVQSKIVLINGSLDNKILKYYRLLPGLLKATLNKLDFLGMKTTAEKVSVEKLGITRTKIEATGNMKFDCNSKMVSDQERAALRRALNIPDNAEIIVAGSTHPGEEELLFKIYADLKNELKDLVLIIAPRQVDRTAEIRQLGKSCNLEVIERTKIKADEFKEDYDSRVIILDTIGELTDFYSIATITFVGGSLVNIGGHNLLEPIFYGKPVLFGPYIYKFKESAEILTENRIGTLVKNEEELKNTIRSLLKDKNRLEQVGQCCARVLCVKAGALQRNTEIIREHLEQGCNSDRK